MFGQKKLKYIPTGKEKDFTNYINTGKKFRLGGGTGMKFMHLVDLRLGGAGRGSIRSVKFLFRGRILSSFFGFGFGAGG